jgi:hypothetical protein
MRIFPMTHRLILRTAAAIVAVFLGSPLARADAGLGLDPDVKALADTIDGHTAARWRERDVRPSAPADDAEYLRRVYLDLVGQVPTLTEVRDFLDDPAKNKRARLIERLLKTDAHARFFADEWRKTLLANSPNQFAGGALDTWLQQRFHDNVGYDKVAREILTASPANGSLSVFFQANENKPENLAGAAARGFLGVRIECAQCHDHPFAKWKKQQFWEFAAFFSDVPPGGKRGELTIPNTGKVVQAKLLVGDTPEIKPGDGPRATLADWAVSGDNPYFARAAVNRLWAHFFGVGLADPVDSLGEEAPPSHPQLLDDMARAFAAHRFDLRFVIRAITASQTYGLSSVTSGPGQDDPRLFARGAVRGLTAEQLYDSLAVVTGKGAPLDRPPGRPVAFDAGFGQRADFVARFANRDRPIDASTSILQALHLMNGKPVADATSLEGNRHLRALAEAQGRTTAQRVEELFLLTLARRPRAEETARFVKYIDGGGARADKKVALADVFWVLLNSSEFGLNH